MKNIEELRNEQEGGRNPGHAIGTFLLEHSNSPEYLVGQLTAYLEAAMADLEAERARFRKLAGHDLANPVQVKTFLDSVGPSLGWD